MSETIEKIKICKHRYAIAVENNPEQSFYCMGYGVTRNTCDNCPLKGIFPRE